MPPRKNQAEDDWSVVADPKKRKQIQDRLAQRARRKRLAQSQESDLVLTSDAIACTRSLSSTLDLSSTSRGLQDSGVLDIVDTSVSIPSSAALASEAEITESSSSLATSALKVDSAITGTAASSLAIAEPGVEHACPNVSSPSLATPQLRVADDNLLELYKFVPSIVDLGVAEQHLLNQPEHTVHTALLYNARILGLKCSLCVLAKSLPVISSTPLSLRPSKLQMERRHHTWIDPFPFVRFRDNIIKWTVNINEDEFVEDLYLMRSFTIKPGSAPWDPNAWQIGKEFYAKWGFLFAWPPD